MRKITNYFENGEYQYSRIVETPDEIVEEIGELILTPKFEDMIYENSQSEMMKTLIEKANKENINLLFYGSAGTGKTFSARMLACETQRNFVYMTGSMGKKKIVDMLLNSKDRSIILIDEIHNIPEKVAEIIYPAIQDNEIYVDGERKKLNLMFIGTTTEPERLPKPLLDRFNQIEFENLEIDKLREVFIKKGCSEDIANKLLNFSVNIRILNNMLSLVKMYGEINEENLVKVFRMKKINVYSGLSDYQQKYLDLLKEMGKASLRTFSLNLNKSENYIKYEIEPDLIRKKMIIVTSRGRELAPSFQDSGYKELKKESEKIHSKFDKTDREFAIGWLKNNKGITEKLGKRYLELVSVVAEMIHNGQIPDEIDFGSFGCDIEIKESIKENYICDL